MADESKEFQVNVSNDTEIEIPGQALFRFLETMVSKMGIHGLKLMLEHNVYMYRPESRSEIIVMLMPNCDCERCLEVKAILKNKIRRGEVDKIELSEILEIFRHKDD